MPSKLRVERWTFNFMELLNDQRGRKEFLQFLEKEFSGERQSQHFLGRLDRKFWSISFFFLFVAENLCFWEACEELRYGEHSKVASTVQSVYE